MTDTARATALRSTQRYADLSDLASQIAETVFVHNLDRQRRDKLTTLLMAFAGEIKRGAIEPLTESQLRAQRIDVLLRRLSELAAESKAMNADEVRFQAEMLPYEGKQSSPTYQLTWERRVYLIHPTRHRRVLADRVCHTIEAPNLLLAIQNCSQPAFPRIHDDYSGRSVELIEVVRVE